MAKIVLLEIVCQHRPVSNGPTPGFPVPTSARATVYRVQ